MHPLEGANFENIAWLRNLGAALISVNGIGALLAASDPKKKKLYDIVLLASCLETIALSWSTYFWEFTATVHELIIIPLILAGASKCIIINIQTQLMWVINIILSGFFLLFFAIIMNAIVQYLKIMTWYDFLMILKIVPSQ